MAHFTAQVSWQRGAQDFLDNRYSRRHVVRFDGGVELPGSSSAHVVPLPFSDPAAVDPEELFVAAISTCHMLWFLSMAVQRKFRVDSYEDSAAGVMEKRDGKTLVTQVTLHPQVQFSGEHQPTREQIEAMHHRAHQECFIANSVKTEVRCQPQYQGAVLPS